jgi:hypothetical protein
MARIEVPYKALPVHEPFHESPDGDRHMFGAVGSGKTYGVCAEAIAWCLEQPGIRGLVTRRTVPELRDTTETVFFDVLPDALFKAGTATRTGGHYADFTFPNGSKVLFRSIDDWNKHKSLNLGFIAWDEMDEFDEETYIGMMTRLRQREPTKEGRARGAGEITRRGTWGASNPAGHNWLWDRYIKQGKGTYFTSTSFDNPYLTPDYFSVLMSMPVPWIKRYVLCQFDDFAGQIYENFSREHHVIPPYQKGLGGYPNYPVKAAFWMGMDPGTRDPTAGLWVVADPDKRRLVGIAEYQEDSLAATVHARAWRRIESLHRMRVSQRIADPGSINVRDRATNNRLSDVYRRLGYNFQLGATRWEDRIGPLATLIENGQFVLTEDCPQTFESIAMAKWKDITPAQRASGEDPPAIPLKKNRHLCDAAEYLGARYLRPTPVQARAIQQEGEPDWSVELRDVLRRKIAKAGRPRGGRTLEGIPL